jgi:hypothetical protein
MTNDTIATPKDVAVATAVVLGENALLREQIKELKEKRELKVRKIAPSELDKVIHRILRKHVEDPNEIPWLVATGTEAASDKISNVVRLLEGALDDEHRLTKTMRVARNAILHIYEGVRRRETVCLMNCTCIAGGSGHLPFPSYTAGCPSKGFDDGDAIGGRLWNTADLLRLHHGYSNPRPVAQSTIYALRQLADELRFQEDDLEREIAKIGREHRTPFEPWQ